VSSRAQDPLCPWNETICAQAAKIDHLHVLQWTRAHNPPCPWDEQTCGCIYNMLLRVVTCMYVLQWACAPWDGQTCAYMLLRVVTCMYVLQWAYALDPPCPCWSGQTAN
jgi:hypothetical protein